MSGWVGGWVGVQPPSPPPPVGLGHFWDSGGFPFYPLFDAGSISGHNMKFFFECGLYVADLGKAPQKHLKSKEHKSCVAASKHDGALGGFIKKRPAFPTPKQIAEVERANLATDYTNSVASSSASASSSLGTLQLFKVVHRLPRMPNRVLHRLPQRVLHNQQQTCALMRGVHGSGWHMPIAVAKRQAGA